MLFGNVYIFFYSSKIFIVSYCVCISNDIDVANIHIFINKNYYIMHNFYGKGL